VNTQGVVLLAARVDATGRVAEPGEANNCKTITTK
jgi:hypothetical protein